MMSSTRQKVVNEAGFDSIEVKMKYEGIYIPVLLTSELMNMKVIDVKRQVVTLHTDLTSMHQKPEDLRLCAVFTGGACDTEIELPDDSLMMAHKDRLIECQELLLDRRILKMKQTLTS